MQFDQTTSGCGILAALTRQDSVGELCNLYGDTPADLYSVVADAVVKPSSARTWKQMMPDSRTLSQIWLERGIDRGLCKGPILRAPYGGSYMSLCDGLVDALEKHLGYVPLEEYVIKVSIPSKYLASIMWRELKAVIDPVMEVKKWLRKCCKTVLLEKKPLVWTSPSGWPMRVADREQTKRKINTFLYGKKVEMTIADQPIDSPLSYTQANKAIVANAIHAFDAAFCATVAYRAAEQHPATDDTRLLCMPSNQCRSVASAAALSLGRCTCSANWPGSTKKCRPIQGSGCSQPRRFTTRWIPWPSAATRTYSAEPLDFVSPYVEF